MPGKNPAEAVREYIHPLQQSVSCLTKCVLRPSGYETNIVQAVTLPETTAELMTRDQEILHFSFSQQFSIAKHWLGYKIQTRSYLYSLENDNHQEIVAFHWHPENTEHIPFPHLHVCGGAGRIREEILNIHFRTDRFAFEDFCHLLIDEFRVVPERDDAAKILNSNLKKFRTHKTW